MKKRKRPRPLPPIKCLACGKRQGSQICKSCRNIVEREIQKGTSPEEIVRIVAPLRQASLLEWVYNER